MAKYKLKEGITLSPFGENSQITNKNLTDSIAEYLISEGRASIEDFEVSEEGFPPAPPEATSEVVPPVVNEDENTITAVVEDSVTTLEGKLSKAKVKPIETIPVTPAPPEATSEVVPPVVKG